MLPELPGTTLPSCRSKMVASDTGVQCSGLAAPSDAGAQCSGLAPPSDTGVQCSGLALPSDTGAQCSGLAPPRDTGAQCSGLAAPRDTGAQCSGLAAPRDTGAQCSGLAAPRDTGAQCSGLAPQARQEGSQGQVRSAAEHAAPGSAQKGMSPEGAEDTSLRRVSVGLSGLSLIFFAIQRQRASRLPLATFLSRLRRSFVRNPRRSRFVRVRACGARLRACGARSFAARGALVSFVSAPAAILRTIAGRGPHAIPANFSPKKW
jgi:hypothetical protein